MNNFSIRQMFISGKPASAFTSDQLIELSSFITQYAKGLYLRELENIHNSVERARPTNQRR
jgi:hypothetical protein